jgi:tetratricopeptide (TPR) repeat protein
LPLARAAELLLARHDASRAGQMAVIALKRTPTAGTGLVIARIAAALFAEGRVADRDAVHRLVDQLDNALPGDGRVRLLRAQVAAAEGQRDAAAAMLREFLLPASREHPLPDDALLLQAAAVSRAAHLGLESALLARADQLHGPAPSTAFDQAMAVAAGGDQGAALKVFDDARARAAGEAGRSLPVEWAVARARLLELTGDPAAAANWRKLGDANVGNVSVQQAVLAARAVHNDRSFRARTIDRLAALLGPQSIVCALARAEMLIENRAGDADDRAIAELLKQIIASHPALPDPRVLWASHLERIGKIDEAIDQVQVAAAANPDPVSLSLKLSGLYWEKGDYDRARELAARVAGSKASSPAEVHAAARLLAEMGDDATAVAALEQLSSPGARGDGPPDPPDLLLAGLYWERGAVDKADAIVSRALASPATSADPQVLAFSARLFASQGKSAEMERALGAIDRMTLPAGRKELAHAEALAASGNLRGAERACRLAASAAPQDPAAWQALIGFLYGEGRGSDAASAIDEALARLPSDAALLRLKQSSRGLSVACQFQEMRPAVQDYVRDPLNRPAPGHILSAVARAAAMSAGDAAAEARALAMRYPHVESVQLWAIRAFLRARRLADAAPTIGQALTAFPESSQTAAVAATFYASRSQWAQMLDAALQWRNRLRGPAAAGGEAERAETAIARALIRLGRASEATNRLEPVVGPFLSHPGQHPELLVAYADSLQATGQAGKAAGLLALAKDDALWRRACIRFAAGQLGPETARTWLQQIQSWTDQGSTDEVCEIAAGWALLSSRSPGAVECGRRAQALFADIEGRPTASPAAIEGAGAYAERSGDAAKAITLYRRAIAADPARTLAMNDLAVLLANRGGPGDPAEAARDAAAVAKAHPDEPEFLDTLALVQAKARDFPAAQRAMSQAIELDPENPRWRITLAQLFADGGQTAQAERAVAEIDAAGTDLATLAPSLREKLAALRARLEPATGAPTALKPAPAAMKRSG